MTQLARNRILVGDARKLLGRLPEASIDCVITSPPYFQLRDYGITGQIGLEASVDTWVDELLIAARGLARVLKPTGSLWLNLGDTYSRRPGSGAPRKSLLLTPERLLLALSADGWIVRNRAIWAKTNPMPDSVGDRLSNSYDLVYFLTRQPTYFFDLDAIRLPHRRHPRPRPKSPHPHAEANASAGQHDRARNRGLAVDRHEGEVGYALGRNPGDVWPIASANFRGAHFATFPTALVERPLLATCPELVCDACDTPFRRSTSARRETYGNERRRRPSDRRVRHYKKRYTVIRTRGPLKPRCPCSSTARPGVVLDPFFGAGTVALVAERHHRDWIGIELNPTYARLAKQRLVADRAARDADGPTVNATQPVASTAKPSTERSTG